MIIQYYSINYNWNLSKPQEIDLYEHSDEIQLSQYEFTLIKTILNQSNNLSECLLYLHEKLWVTSRINNTSYENLTTALVRMGFRITVSQSKEKDKQQRLPYFKASAGITEGNTIPWGMTRSFKSRLWFDKEKYIALNYNWKEN